MPEINQLPTRRLTAGDTFPFFSTNNGDAAKASFTALATLMSQLMGTDANAQTVTQYESPDYTDFTATIEATDSNTWLIITPTGSYSCEVVLPSAAAAFDGMEIIVTNGSDVYALSLSYSSSGAAVINPEDQYGPGSAATFRYEAVTKRWYQISQYYTAIV